MAPLPDDPLISAPESSTETKQFSESTCDFAESNLVWWDPSSDGPSLLNAASGIPIESAQEGISRQEDSEGEEAFDLRAAADLCHRCLSQGPKEFALLPQRLLPLIPEPVFALGEVDACVKPPRPDGAPEPLGALAPRGPSCRRAFSLEMTQRAKERRRALPRCT